jgi:hypothetical protein
LTVPSYGIGMFILYFLTDRLGHAFTVRSMV